MNFTAYIERQKNLIRSRHEGETFLVTKEEIVFVNDTERILKELAALKGLRCGERACVKRAEYRRAM